MTRREDKPFTLAHTWLLDNRVNLMLLNQPSTEQFACTANARARSIGDQLAHLHNVRAMWLEANSKTSLEKIEKGCVTKERVTQCLQTSAQATAQVFAQAESSGKLRQG